MFLRDDTFQQALSFLVAQTSFIEPQVVRIKYPELNYAQFVPIDSSANEWAKSITFFSIDMVGQADWFNHMARDIPFADVMRQKHEQGIEMAAIGYRYTLEELGQAMMLPGTNLTTERAAGMATRANRGRASLIGRSGSSAFRLSTSTVLMSLTGSPVAKRPASRSILKGASLAAGPLRVFLHFCVECGRLVIMAMAPVCALVSWAAGTAPRIGHKRRNAVSIVTV